MTASILDRLFKFVTSFLSRTALGPVAVLLFGALIALLNMERTEDAVPSVSSSDYSDVDDWYGPGAYYGWLVTAVASVCHSDPEPPSPTEINADVELADVEPADVGPTNVDTEATKRCNDRIALLEAISTLAAVAYPGAAAIDMIIRIARMDFGNQFAAADRTAQVGWIFATFYLLHHIIGGGVVRGLTRIPSPPTIMWICLWILVTGAMGGDNVARRRLASTSLKVFLPFIVCIPVPMVTVAGVHWWRRHNGARVETWLIRALNVGTFILCIVYVPCPGHLKYDAESPQAPRSGSRITNMGQAAALAVAVVGALPRLALKSWRTARKYLTRE